MRKLAVTWLTPLILISALLLLTMPAGQATARHTKVERESPPASLAKADSVSQAQLRAAYGRLPLSFEANQGQADSRVQFLSRGHGYSLYLSSTEAVLGLGEADYASPNREQTRESLDSLPQSRFSAFQLPHSALRNPHSAFRTPPSTVLRMKLMRANSMPKSEGLQPLPGKANYFLGNNPKKWRTDVPTYGKVPLSHEIE
jgi:hypothetical protein